VPFELPDVQGEKYLLDEVTFSWEKGLQYQVRDAVQVVVDHVANFFHHEGGGELRALDGHRSCRCTSSTSKPLK